MLDKEIESENAAGLKRLRLSDSRVDRDRNRDRRRYHWNTIGIENAE
jgi:hypothetical protein